MNCSLLHLPRHHSRYSYCDLSHHDFSPAHLVISNIFPQLAGFHYEVHTQKHFSRSRGVSLRVVTGSGLLSDWNTDRERDRTLRAGTLNGLLDTDFPRGSQRPVRSQTESPSGLAVNSKQVTPWLFRRVNASASLTAMHPEMVTTADVMGTANPPSYHAAQENCPSKGRSTGARSIETYSPADTTLPRSPTRAPRGLAWLSRPVRTAAPSDAAANLGLGQPSLRCATEAEWSRPGLTIRRCAPPPESVNPPCYRSRELSITPTLPPYSATGASFAPSKEPQPQDGSRKPIPAFSGDGPRPNNQLVPESAVSRIQAAYKVSNDLGNAVMMQEVRLATPVALSPRAGRRFVSVTELEGIRKVNARADRRPGERESRQRALSKPSDCSGRNRDGKIHRTASERVNPMKSRHDKRYG